MELVSIWPLIEDQLRILCAGLLNVSIDRGDLSELLREVTRCRPTGNAKDLAHQLHQARNEFAHRKGTDLPETVWLSMFSAAARFADEFPNHPSSEHIRSLYAQAKPILSQLLTIPTQKTIHSDDLVRWTKNQGFLNRYDKRIARKWIIDQVVSAIEREDSHLVVIHGAPGVGKSTIAAEWIETHQTTCAYHINEYDNEDSKSTDALVSALVGSLLETNPEFQPGVTYRDIVGGSDSSVPAWNSLSITARWNRFIVEPLTKWNLATNGCFTLLVDALDETSQQQIDFLIKHHADLPYTAKIIVTSRPEIKVPKAAVVIGIDDPRQNNDIRSYVALNLPNANLSKYEWNSIVDEITSQANGVFVAAKLLIDAYNGEGYAPSAPHAMNNLFAEWFGRAVPVEHRTLTSQLLRILCLAYSSIPTTVLRSALNISDRELREYLGRLGSLVDVQDNRVRLFHKLLADWILDPDTLIIDGSMESAQLRLAEVMLEDDSDYAVRYAVVHLIDARLDEFAVDKLTNFRYMQWRVEHGCARACFMDLCSVKTQHHTQQVLDWYETFRYYAEHWTIFPKLFHQDCRNCPDYSDPCIKAYDEPLVGPWVMEINKLQSWNHTKQCTFDSDIEALVILEVSNEIILAMESAIFILQLDTLEVKKQVNYPEGLLDYNPIVAASADRPGNCIWLVARSGLVVEFDLKSFNFHTLGQLEYPVVTAYFSFDLLQLLCICCDGNYRIVKTTDFVVCATLPVSCIEKAKSVQWSRSNDCVAIVDNVLGEKQVTLISSDGNVVSQEVDGTVVFHADDLAAIIVMNDQLCFSLDLWTGKTIEIPNDSVDVARLFVSCVGFNKHRKHTNEENSHNFFNGFFSSALQSTSSSDSTLNYFASASGKWLEVTKVIDEEYLHVHKSCNSISTILSKSNFLQTMCNSSLEMRFYAPDCNNILFVDRQNVLESQNEYDIVFFHRRHGARWTLLYTFDLPNGYWVSDVTSLNFQWLSLECSHNDEENEPFCLLFNLEYSTNIRMNGFQTIRPNNKGFIGACVSGWWQWESVEDISHETGSLVSDNLRTFWMFDGTAVPIPESTDQIDNYDAQVQSHMRTSMQLSRNVTFNDKHISLHGIGGSSDYWQLTYNDNQFIELIRFDPIRPNRVTYRRFGEEVVCELMWGNNPATNWYVT